MSHKIYLRCWVEDDGTAIPGNRNHCPIRNSIILSDDDIVFATVDSDFIVFSRRSTGLRYKFHTPEEAIPYVKEFDKFVDTDDNLRTRIRKMSIHSFELVLTSKHLVEIRERRQGSKRSAERAVRDTAERLHGPTFTSLRIEQEREEREAAEAAMPAAAGIPTSRTRTKVQPRRRTSQRV